MYRANIRCDIIYRVSSCFVIFSLSIQWKGKGSQKPKVSSTIYGYSWLQKVVSAFIWASDDPFFAPKNGHFQWFGVQKNGSSDAPIRKRTPLIVVNYSQKWRMRHLFHMGQFLQGGKNGRLMSFFFSHMLYMPKTLWLDLWAHFKVP